MALFSFARLNVSLFYFASVELADECTYWEVNVSASFSLLIQCMFLSFLNQVIWRFAKRQVLSFISAIATSRVMLPAR